jgi:hypothetical protein
MFEKYNILQSNHNSIKLQHKTTGDISWRYKTYCPRCGKDRGWKKKHQAIKLCRSCSHIIVVKKYNYTNINYNDYICVFKFNGKTYYKYRAVCKLCGKDRGYIELSNHGRPCRSCSKLLMHKNRTIGQKLEIAKKISMAQTGHTVFSGFTTSEQEIERQKFKYLGLSKQCFTRDDYTCQKCKMTGVKLNAHHKNSFANFTEKRFLLTNLVTLCEHCHRKFHMIFGKQNNTEDQFNWFLLNN